MAAAGLPGDGGARRPTHLHQGLGACAVHLRDLLMRALGISAFYHDAAAALVEDGQVVAAAQEERFTRKKHDPEYPRHAIDYCLSVAGVPLSAIDSVVFYDKPILKFDRLI